MSLNKFMHEENVFKKPPDFKDLALRYPEFRKHTILDISGKVLLDFKDPDALRTLSKILLLDEFDLRVEIPVTCLIPTIPSRLNYLLWLKDLIQSLPEEQKDVHGLDIGTGASAVYCLLAAKHLGWNMLGTEVDADNFTVAKENVSRNNLQSKIGIIRVDGDQILDAATWPTQDSTSMFHFTMCNPPFFVRESPEDNGPVPSKECEIKTQGGEVKFIKQMADQSCNIKNRVKIFSTLCGHKSSLVPIKQYLTALGVKSLATTEFCQGKTMRWGIAWTWDQLDLNSVKSLKYKKSKEKPFNWSIKVSNTSALNLFQSIKTWLAEVKVDVTVQKETKHYCSARIVSYDQLWQNQRKRRRQNRQDKTEKQNDAKGESEEGKFSELNSNSSNDTNSMAEASLMQELLNSDGNRMVNSFLMDHHSKDSSKSISSPTQQEQNQLMPEPDKTETEETTSGKNETEETSSGKNGTEDTSSSKKEAQLEANIKLRLAGPVLLLEIFYLGGQLGRDGVHQLLQYLKNKQAAKIKTN
eukprot:TRINITY_DN5410_c0_g1_i17.p1 TRINITY_DN5410_c0_g1~~TRINITY_DN5410_c0_g1_i17.p1  ORF type:complete len:526 (-),score=101.23 TRINITY_DN5410_c0_g1_i17:137-1714(-)